MNSYESTITVQSEAYPGVSFVVRKPSYGRRMEFDRDNAEFRAAIQKLQKEYKQLYRTQEAAEREHRFGIERQINDLKLVLKTAREEEQAALNAQILELENAPVPVDEELLEAMEATGTEANRITALMYNPTRIRWGLERVDGLVIDGVAADVEMVIARGLEGLTWEILQAIDLVSGMTGDQLKNLQSPIIFSGLVGSTTSDTTATAVSTPESTEAVTAAE